MRFSIIALALAFSTNTLAVAVPAPAADLVDRTGSAGGCNRNNCFRAVFAQIEEAEHFCPWYTHRVRTATTSLGPWQTQCDSSPSKVSSACSCIVTPTPHHPKPDCKPRGHPCDLDNYRKTCCRHKDDDYYHKRDDDEYVEKDRN
ncbi:hypothetical protein ABW20_dc0105628 [Dactylellina cionopaga]|nr:hypothetical protein ABW20_dc0105628 [Dactylellina cionopaga]